MFFFDELQAQDHPQGETVIFNGTLFGRSTLDFRPQTRNIQFSIPKGSQARVIETRQLKQTGSYALKIRITHISDSKGASNAKLGDETWVYFSQRDPWLSLKNADGFIINDPEIPLKEKAKIEADKTRAQGVSNKPKLPTKEDVLREQLPIKNEDPNLDKGNVGSGTEGGVCLHCSDRVQSPTQANQSDIATLRNELQRGSQYSQSTDIGLIEWNSYPDVVAYSDSERVTRLIRYGMRNRHQSTQRLCYRYVKRALQASDLVKEYPEGVKATQAIGDLKQEGFRNLMDNPTFKNLTPETAPKGALLVYCKSTNRGPCDNSHPGHAEIKTDWGSKGGYVSDFFRSTNQPLYGRKLIGVMVK
jgi:hypothetical protein